jgi:hypothetical protein
MEQSLADLVLRNVITPEVALARSSRADQLLGLLERSGMTYMAALPAAHGGDATPKIPNDNGLRLATEV